MEVLRRSPMFAILISLVSALSLYDKFGIFALVFGVPLIFTGVMFCSYIENFNGQWQVFITALIFAVLCALRICYGLTEKAEENFYGISDEGLVTNVRTWGRMYAAEIKTQNNGKLVTIIPFAYFNEGSRINFEGYVMPLRTESHENDFNEARYWRARGVRAKLNIDVKSVEFLPEKFSFALMRHKISRNLTIYASKLTGEYLNAAWLGEHTKELDEKHRKWGTSHLLAVSGFHVGIVILISGLIFNGNAILMSIILWSYVILTGASTSALRAGLMLQIGICSRLLGRKIDGINSVSTAGVILLLESPFLFWDIGWRLSIIAALAISSMSTDIFMSFLMSPVIFLITFPQVSQTFKGVPIVGIILNVFAPFYFSGAFTVASAVMLLKLINFPFNGILMLASEGIFYLWEYTADLITKFIPYRMQWEYFASWFGVGMLVFIICRYFNFSVSRALYIMTAVCFSAFIFFR